MKLLRLTLRNFKGVREFVLDLDGADADVFGANGVGKTTLADAWSWLLFGKDSQGRGDFDVKTLDEENNVVPGLEHSVEAELETATGLLTLRRTYKEVWTRKRGSSAATFEGNETDYHVNTVPVRKGDFDRRVAELCPEKTFRVLTDPFHFVESMKWQDRRALLFTVCGDLSDEDVIASDPELADLPAVLGQHTLDEYRKIATARRKEINAELGAIPARIDEANRALPTIVPGDWTAALEAARAALTDAQELRATVVAGGAAADKTKSLREIEGRMQERANALRALPDPAREAALARARDLEARRAGVSDEMASLARRVESAKSDLARMDRQLVAQREQYAKENAKAFEGEAVCPACGQELPAERREAALAAFNEAKSKRLAEIRAEGVPLRQRRDALAAEVQGWEAEHGEKVALYASLGSERAAVVVPAASAPNPMADHDYAELHGEAEMLKGEIAALRTESGGILAGLDEQIREAQGQADEASRHLQSIELRANTEKRIATLKAREKELAGHLERVDRELFLCDEFVRAKVASLTERINARFRIARFRLFANQVNGAVEERCDVMRNGVPYGSLNHGSRVAVGLDVVDVLAAHFGFAPPIFLDNSESVTDIPGTAGQQIRLVVSKADKALRVETVGLKEGALF